MVVKTTWAVTDGRFFIFRLIEGIVNRCGVSNTRNQIFSELQSLLRYHKVIGISNYPRNAHTESFLAKMPQQVSPDVVKKTAVVTAAAPQKKPPIVESPLKISDIEAEIISCHACELYKQRIYPVPGRGPEKIRLLLVGDWLAADATGDLPADRLFGVQQDEMLSKMLVAINLSADDVFITNVIKCAVPVDCQPQATHVQSCSSFLRRQIAALAPEIICTMGIVAARTMLEMAQPLSRLRGRFHTYEVEKDNTIPVIVTYHPTYLLQNPEMKRATWTDLQFLAKKMGLL